MQLVGVSAVKVIDMDLGEKVALSVSIEATVCEIPGQMGKERLPWPSGCDLQVSLEAGAGGCFLIDNLQISLALREYKW